MLGEPVPCEDELVAAQLAVALVVAEVAAAEDEPAVVAVVAPHRSNRR